MPHGCSLSAPEDCTEYGMAEPLAYRGECLAAISVTALGAHPTSHGSAKAPFRFFVLPLFSSRRLVSGIALRI
jgi:hypothetical protein